MQESGVKPTTVAGSRLCHRVLGMGNVGRGRDEWALGLVGGKRGGMVVDMGRG